MADSPKDHDTSLALAQAVMLPNDIADLVVEGSEKIRDLLVMQQVQVRILARLNCFFFFASEHLVFIGICFSDPLESILHLEAYEEIQKENKFSRETNQVGFSCS